MFRRKSGRILPTWRRFVEKSKRSGRNWRRHGDVRPAVPVFSAVAPGGRCGFAARLGPRCRLKAGPVLPVGVPSRYVITRMGPTRRAERVRDRRAVRGGSEWKTRRRLAVPRRRSAVPRCRSAVPRRGPPVPRGSPISSRISARRPPICFCMSRSWALVSSCRSPISSCMSRSWALVCLLHICTSWPLSVVNASAPPAFPASRTW